MSEYKIEKGIAIPPMSHGGVAPPKPLYRRPDYIPTGENGKLVARMEVGDSFFVPNEEVKDILNKWYNPATRQGRRITARKVDGGVRVWLTRIY